METSATAYHDKPPAAFDLLQVVLQASKNHLGNKEKDSLIYWNSLSQQLFHIWNTGSFKEIIYQIPNDSK